MFLKMFGVIRRLPLLYKRAEALINMGDEFRQNNRHLELGNLSLWNWAIASLPQYRDPRHLTPHGFRVYSQWEEDGIIDQIFQRIGTTNRQFVEFGTQDGMETNTTHLLLQGWSGAWIECDSTSANLIRTHFRPLLDDGRLKFKEAFITAESISDLFRDLEVPTEPDLLSIDIDGNDFWVWQALSNYRPRVVVAEYNADFGPIADWVMPCNPDHRFGWSRHFGASLKAFERLGREKGYCLVGCNFYGVNAFFVREDLVGEHFRSPYDSRTHFEPPRHSNKTLPGWNKDPREIGGFRVA